MMKKISHTSGKMRLQHPAVFLLVLSATSKVRLTDVSELENKRERERAHNANAAFDLFREVMIWMPSLGEFS